MLEKMESNKLSQAGRSGDGNAGDGVEHEEALALVKQGSDTE